MAIVDRMGRAAGIRSGEALPIALIAATFAALEAGRGFGEVGATTLVLARLGADALPVLYIPLGLLSLTVAIVYGAALGRVRRGRLFIATLLGIGGLLGIEWMVLSADLDIVAVTWLTVMAAGSIAVTIGWTVAGSTLDARQAKRLFPLCTAAAIAGNFLGSLLAGPVAASAGTAVLVLAEGALFALAAGAILVLATYSDAPGWAPRPTTSRSVGKDVRAGFDEVRGSPLLRLVALAYILFAVLLFSITFPFQRAAVEAYPDEASLARVLGVVAAIVAGTSLLVSLTVANRFYARYGVATAALLLPLVYLVGFGIWILAFSFVTAAAVTIVQQVTQRGLSNAAWSAFYNVTPVTRRAQAMAFNDGVPGQLGIVLSGVLLLTAGRLLAPAQVFWLGLATAAVCTGIVVAIRRTYGAALLRTLRSGTAEQVLEGGPGLGSMLDSPDVRIALVAALAEPDAGTRRMAAALLSRSRSPEVRRALDAALDDPDPGVQGEAVAAVLARPGDAPVADGTVPPREHAEATLRRLLSGSEDELTAGLRALERTGRRMSPKLRAAALSHASGNVRAAAMILLRDETDEAARAAMLDGLGDADPTVRRAAATALAGRDDVADALVDRLRDGDDARAEVVLAALEGHGPAVRDPLLQWAERHVDRAIRMTDDLAVLQVAAADRPDDASLAFLCDTIRDRVTRHQDLALAAMAALGEPAARGVIRRCLRSEDADVRAQAIEALDSVGDRRLGGAVARLVEHVPARPERDPDAIVRALGDDDDPWIAGLAALVLAKGGDMPDAARSLGDIETMLELRRVPLFGRLAPEDLQRIAAVAAERWFKPGEDLVHEGEVGDELFVILEGRVVVHRHEVEGEERILRTYEAGDHIGELAVLLERPRVATVTADDGSVRTLVIGGEGLRAILRERPEAAMVMLATLAERMSTQ